MKIVISILNINETVLLICVLVLLTILLMILLMIVNKKKYGKNKYSLLVSHNKELYQIDRLNYNKVKYAV